MDQPPQTPEPKPDPAASGGPPQDTPRPPIWQERRAEQSSPPRLDPVRHDAHGPVPPAAGTRNPDAARPGQAAPPAFSRPASAGGSTGPALQWPTSPPRADDQPHSTQPYTTQPHSTQPYATQPYATQPTPAARRGRGLVVVGILGAIALGLIGLLLGFVLVARSSDVADAPIEIASPTPRESPTEAPTPAPVPTEEPAPTPEPTEAPQNDATLDTRPGVLSEDADEPVTAVAQAVAPAVVLIQHETGQGSGIIYDEQGLILTNAHVVGEFTDVSVQLPSGIRVEGTVIGADPNTDVAVVSIDPAAEFGVAELAPDASVEVGQLAVAIGSPFGLDQTVTSGIVSAKGRVVGTVAMIQTDAPINPGNSGGALADRQGRVIGMNTAIRTDGSGGNVGVGFAIPSDTAKTIADRIIKGESLDRGYLGVEGATPQPGNPGVIITNVLPGTGAEAAGLQVDDLIVGFNGDEIQDMTDLAAAVRLQPPGAEVPVIIIRGDQTLSFFVTLGTLQN